METAMSGGRSRCTRGFEALEEHGIVSAPCGPDTRAADRCGSRWRVDRDEPSPLLARPWSFR
jgi:hypothetical protein